MLKCISHIHVNHSNNPIKLIVHLVIIFRRDFLFLLVKCHHPSTWGCSELKATSAWNFFQSRKREHKKTACLANDLPCYNPYPAKQNLIKSILEKKKSKLYLALSLLVRPKPANRKLVVIKEYMLIKYVYCYWGIDQSNRRYCA